MLKNVINSSFLTHFIFIGLLAVSLTSCRCTDIRQPEADKKNNKPQEVNDKKTSSLGSSAQQPQNEEEQMTQPEKEEQIADAAGEQTPSETAAPEQAPPEAAEQVAAVDPMDTKEVTKATSQIHGLKEGQVKGLVTFTKVPEGVQIVADIEGLTPGEHGFHVHEHGSCQGDGTSAGGHFNPTQSKHGGPDSSERHVGDFGNLVADENGKAHYDRIDSVISLNGENSIVGRSLVIHADRDDLVTQPTGNSGARIACGVIEAS